MDFHAIHSTKHCRMRDSEQFLFWGGTLWAGGWGGAGLARFAGLMQVGKSAGLKANSTYRQVARRETQLLRSPSNEDCSQARVEDTLLGV